jgi:multiple sugar transport system ATP-binding protein
MSTVELEHVTVKRSGKTLLDGVNLTVADGELIGVIGASGSGKTTLLRAIAGLERLQSGTIWIGGVDVTHVPTSDRDVSMVFQRSVLIPNRDVQRNIAFPLEIRHQHEGEISTRVRAETRALHIEALLARSPQGLSAGESQLVQVARALVRMPSLLLLDDPLARLDASLTQNMRLELRSLQQGYAVTTFLTTTEPVEAMSLPDRIVVLDAGHVVQVGAPIEVYERPVNLVAAASTGHVSILTAQVEADSDGFWLVHPSFRHRAWWGSLADYVGAAVLVALRPTWLRVTSDGPVRATVTEVNLVTGTITVAFGTDAKPDHVEIATAGPAHRRGDPVAFCIEEVALFDPLTGNALP